MIRKKDELGSVTEVRCCDGSGKAVLNSILSSEELYGAVKSFSLVTLNSGDEVGYHVHNGDMEIYTVLKGQAVFNDNGSELILNEYDSAITYDGQGHAIKPVDGTKLVFLACMINK